VSLRSLLEFQVRDFTIDDESAYAGNSRIFLQEFEGGRKKAVMQLHVSVDEAEISSATVLKAELRTCSA